MLKSTKGWCGMRNQCEGMFKSEIRQEISNTIGLNIIYQRSAVNWNLLIGGHIFHLVNRSIDYIEWKGYFVLGVRRSSDLLYVSGHEWILARAWDGWVLMDAQSFAPETIIVLDMDLKKKQMRTWSNKKIEQWIPAILLMTQLPTPAPGPWH